MAVQGFKLSPDGRYLAFTAPDGGVDRVWIRPLDSLQQRALPATDGATYPFFSPDSAHIGFFAQGKLKRMVVTGGPPQTLCDAPDPRGGAWGPNGDIVFAPGVNSVLYRVRAEGGSPTPVAKLTLPSGSGASLRFPDFLPGSERFFFGNKPGRRPWAYWRFDIGLPAAPVSPLEEIAELNARGLLDRSEQMLIEKRVSTPKSESISDLRDLRASPCF